MLAVPVDFCVVTPLPQFAVFFGSVLLLIDFSMHVGCELWLSLMHWLHGPGVLNPTVYTYLSNL